MTNFECQAFETQRFPAVQQGTGQPARLHECSSDSGNAGCMITLIL